MRLSTLNVIELTDGNLLSIRSFSNDKEGCKEAENLFILCVAENKGNLTKGEREELLKNKYFYNGTYEVYLRWSIC